MNKYSDELKIIILSELNAKVPVLALSKKYNISRNTIYRWIHEKELEPIENTAKDKEIKRLKSRIERLKEIIQIIKEANCLPSAPLKEKLYALERIYGSHSVRILCEALDVDRGTFYNHILRNKKSNTCYAKQRELLRVAIQKVYDDNRQIFGVGKITAILKEQGYKTSEDTVRKLMADMGLTSIRQHSKALFEKERKTYCKNHLNQNFTTTAPNQVWVSDVTCYSFQQKNYYICVILDLFSRKVIGCKVSHRNSTQLVKATFKMAYESRKPPEGLIFHTDRGTNYKSHTFMSYLKSCNVIQSFSRAHMPYDNSVMESFFSSFKREELYRTKYKSEKELKMAIEDYIEFYNSKRPHYQNNYKTPTAKEQGFWENGD